MVLSLEFRYVCRAFFLSLFLSLSLSFSLSLSLSLLLISLYCKLCQVIFSIEESRRWHQQLLMSHICYLWFSKLCHFCDSRIADIICNSLNYTTFLNIFGAILFYLFFYMLKYKNSLWEVLNRLNPDLFVYNYIYIYISLPSPRMRERSPTFILMDQYWSLYKLNMFLLSKLSPVCFYVLKVFFKN